MTDRPDDPTDRWLARFGGVLSDYLDDEDRIPAAGAAAFAGLADGEFAGRGPGEYDIEEML